MSKPHARRRATLAATLAFTAALGGALAASPAQAQDSIARSVCDNASNRPDLVYDNLEARLADEGFTGLSPALCEDFTKQQVKGCIKVVKIGTDCTVLIDEAVASMAKYSCDAITDSASRKSCKSNVKQELKSDKATAKKVVRLLGINECNGDFANDVFELCVEGVTP
jgi:hypothetical protein